METEHRMHENSLEAYWDVYENLSPKRMRVFEWIAGQGPLTRQRLAAISETPINTVCGRVRELLDAGMIVEEGEEFVENRPRALLRAVQPDEFELVQPAGEMAHTHAMVSLVELAALEKDRRRLELMVRAGFTLLDVEIDENDEMRWGMLDQGMNDYITGLYDNWRDAIDEAMSDE